MKTQVLVLALISSVFATQLQGQNRTIVNAQNSEISDNLDLRVVASIFGNSRNLQDFERQLNDPKLQISNLDLNNDRQVDYLRVIESVQKRTHIVIIQSVLDRDIYQDVASIEVEKNWINNIQIQVVGNPYFYGQNYIYEPVFYNTPLIYADFWASNYQPYYSNWNWNYYPSYYYTWNTYPVFRYRNNVNICLNNYYSNNHYNYVNYRRSSYATDNYNRSRSNGYEREYPDYSFSRRNATVNNRYELDQVRNTNGRSRNEIGYVPRRSETPRGNPTIRDVNLREATPQRTTNQREYSQNRAETPREAAPQRTTNQRDYSQNNAETPREAAPQRTTNQREYSQNRTETPREAAPQRSAPQREYTPTRTETLREAAPQRTEPTKENSYSRSTTSGSNNNSSRGGNRRT